MHHRGRFRVDLWNVHQHGIKLVPNWRLIGTKTTTMAANWLERHPHCNRDGFEASYSEFYAKKFVRIYPSSGTVPGRFVECSPTWHQIGTKLGPNWYQKPPQRQQFGWNGVHIVTAMVSRPVIVSFMQRNS